MARLLDRYVLAPGCCQICRASQRPEEEAIVDTLVDITDGPFENGRLYLCRSCSVEIAMLWRFAPPELVDKVTAERDAAILQCREMAEELATLRAVKAAIEAFRPAPAVELEQTKPYWCEPCQREFQNPSAWGRHQQARHGAPHSAIRRGDEALQTEEEVPA